MLEKFKKAFKAPETPVEKMKREMSERHAKTDEEIKKRDTERAELMKKKREQAEVNSIEQAQSDLRELPGKIAALEDRIKQLRDIAKGNRESAYAEQFKSGGDRGAYEQHAVMVDFQADAVAKEKSRLEVKLNEAKSLLKSRGLMEAE